MIVGEYFKPLRRKIGVGTLLLACLFAMGWVRALRTRDLIDTGRFIPSSFGIAIDSKGQWLTLMTRSGDAVCLENGEINTILPVSDANVVLNTMIKVPYWSLIMPLALLSTWLLLSKPRPAKFRSSGC